MQEWQECLVKAAPLLRARRRRLAGRPPLPLPAQVRRRAGVFETMLAVDGRIVALADHLARLAASCRELYRLRLPDELADAAGRGGWSAAAGRHRVRLRCGSGTAPARDRGGAGRCRPAAGGRCTAEPGRTGSWRHKWADRSWLAAQERPGSCRCSPHPARTAELAWRPAAATWSSSPGRDVLRTPVLDEAVLPGVTRRRLLDAALDRGWLVELGPVRLADLLDRPAGAQRCPASRGVVAVDRLDGAGLALDHELLAELARLARLTPRSIGWRRRTRRRSGSMSNSSSS